MSYPKEMVKEAIKLHINGTSEKEIADILDHKSPKGMELSERTIRNWIAWYKLVIEVQGEFKVATHTSRNKELVRHFENLVDIAKAILPDGPIEEVFLSQHLMEIAGKFTNLEASSKPGLTNCFLQHVAVELKLKKPKDIVWLIRNKPKQFIRAISSIYLRGTVLGVCNICAQLDCSNNSQ